MNFFHALFPNEPEEGTQGPFSLVTGLAEGLAKRDVVGGDIVQRAEGNEGVPYGGGPQPQLG